MLGKSRSTINERVGVVGITTKSVWKWAADESVAKGEIAKKLKDIIMSP